MRRSGDYRKVKEMKDKYMFDACSYFLSGSSVHTGVAEKERHKKLFHPILI